MTTYYSQFVCSCIHLPFCSAGCLLFSLPTLLSACCSVSLPAIFLPFFHVLLHHSYFYSLAVLINLEGAKLYKTSISYLCLLSLPLNLSHLAPVSFSGTKNDQTKKKKNTTFFICVLTIKGAK